jgi:dehydrogenase/reductase SDR family protein 12
MISAVLDTVLDRSVVGGYTSLGCRLRQHWWDDSELPSMAGKVALVTGATSGLGTATALGFARLGATVHLLARDRSRGEDARAAGAEQADAEVHLHLCDLSRLASVREWAQRFATEAPALDVLVNNARVLTPERTLSADGIELTFAVNVLAPFLLTAELLSPLRREGADTIVWLGAAATAAQSSGGFWHDRVRAP